MCTPTAVLSSTSLAQPSPCASRALEDRTHKTECSGSLLLSCWSEARPSLRWPRHMQNCALSCCVADPPPQNKAIRPLRWRHSRTGRAPCTRARATSARAGCVMSCGRFLRDGLKSNCISCLYGGLVRLAMFVVGQSNSSKVDSRDGPDPRRARNKTRGPWPDGGLRTGEEVISFCAVEMARCLLQMLIDMATRISDGHLLVDRTRLSQHPNSHRCDQTTLPGQTASGN